MLMDESGINTSPQIAFSLMSLMFLGHLYGSSEFTANLIGECSQAISNKIHTVVRDMVYDEILERTINE